MTAMRHFNPAGAKQGPTSPTTPSGRAPRNGASGPTEAHKPQAARPRGTNPPGATFNTRNMAQSGTAPVGHIPASGSDGQPGHAAGSGSGRGL